MTQAFSANRWLRVRVLGIRESGTALVRVLDGSRELLEVPVYRLRVQS